MTEEAKRLFVADRAVVMAAVIMMRRDDLTINKAKTGSGLDLLVSINRDPRTNQFDFGVKLLGAMPTMSVEDVNASINSELAGHGARKYSIPACLFFCTMRDDQAFFTWLAEPVLTDGTPRLIHHTQADCVELTNDRLEQVVERIVTWYDAVAGVMVA